MNKMENGILTKRVSETECKENSKIIKLVQKIFLTFAVYSLACSIRGKKTATTQAAYTLFFAFARSFVPFACCFFGGTPATRALAG